MGLTRAAFALMLKFSILQEPLQMLVDEVDFAYGEGEEAGSEKAPLIVKESAIFEQLFKRFETSSQMRKWFAESKNRISSEIILRLEQEAKNQKENPLDPLTEEEKTELEEEAGKEFEEKIARLYNDTICKTEFMLKLTVPESFSGGRRGGSRSNILTRVETDPKDAEEAAMPVNKQTWVNRLKTWRKVQTATATITTMTSKHVFEQAATSILAILQADVSIDVIQAHIENSVIKAYSRGTALKMVSNVLNIDLWDQLKLQFLFYFRQPFA